MRLILRRATAGLLLASLVAAGSASAQGPYVHPQTGSLAERLEAAEQRIAELEDINRLPPVESGITNVSSGVNNRAIISRLDALERAIEADRKAAAAARQTTTSKPTQSWFGRIHLDYWSFPDTDEGANFFERGDITEDPQDRWTFRRLRFGVRGSIAEQMEYKFEMEFANPNSPTFKDAYIGWNELPVIETMLLGNQKRPYGLDHLNSSRYNVFMERPFVIEANNQDARRLGLCAYGETDDLAYNWRYGVFLSDDISDDGTYLAVDDPGKHHYQAEVAGRFANTIWYDECSDGRGYAHWAISGAAGEHDGTAGPDSTSRYRTRPEARTSTRWIDTGTILGADTWQLIGLEGVVNVGPVQWVSEFQNVWVNRTFGGNNVRFWGAYTYVSYFLTGEHMPWDRESGTLARPRPFENFFLVDRCHGGKGCGTGAWQVAARYSYADYTDEDILGGVGSAFTLGLNWYWTPYSRMQFNYIWGRIEDRYDQQIDGDTGFPGGPVGPTAGDYQILGARFMVDF